MIESASWGGAELRYKKMQILLLPGFVDLTLFF